VKYSIRRQRANTCRKNSRLFFWYDSYEYKFNSRFVFPKSVQRDQSSLLIIMCCLYKFGAVNNLGFRFRGIYIEMARYMAGKDLFVNVANYPEITSA